MACIAVSEAGLISCSCFNEHDGRGIPFECPIGFWEISWNPIAGDINPLDRGPDTLPFPGFVTRTRGNPQRSRAGVLARLCGTFMHVQLRRSLSSNGFAFRELPYFLRNDLKTHILVPGGLLSGLFHCWRWCNQILLA